MTVSTQSAVIRVALVGNPNTGKSTLFNALSGMRQRVGNYPGVTVEKKLGTLEVEGHRFELIDLPGTYSLAPHSPDEMVTVDVLLGRRSDTAPPDMIITIVDASNLERNLYLVSQVLELGRPTILALNMTDVASRSGIILDVDRLREQLGIPVIPLQANRRLGMDQLKQKLLELIGQENNGRIPHRVFPQAFRDEVDGLESLLADRSVPRYLVERLLLDTSGYLEDELLGPAAGGDRTKGDRGERNGGKGDGKGADLSQAIRQARERLGAAGCGVPGVEAIARYEWAERVLEGVVDHPTERQRSWTDRIDSVLTHKLWGTAIFALMMLVVFRAVFSWAVPLMDVIDGAAGWLAGHVDKLMVDGALKSLVIDGVIAGVGGVLVFLPQIFILFFFIAVLEDCGYMARAAYLMDKLMVRVGLSGKSFIPLLSSFACAIPGVMAARVIENRRDRLTTILVAPLMSCSARLPVYSVLIAAFIPAESYFYGLLGLQGLTMFCMYLVGIVTAVIVALILKKTILRGETPAFVMELPTYKFPSLQTVWCRMLERGWAFVRRAGTVILAVAIVVWAAAYYPHKPDQLAPELRDRVAQLDTGLESARASGADPQTVAALEGEQAELQKRIQGAYLQHSFLGRAGKAIEPAVRPLGWDWRIGCAVIASFPAREVVVGTLGVIYNLGGDHDDESTALRDKLTEVRWQGSDQPVFNVPVALSLMVFFALCAQCAATLVVIKRETGSWGWPIFTFVYMTALAYLAALVTYQAGMLFSRWT